MVEIDKDQFEGLPFVVGDLAPLQARDTTLGSANAGQGSVPLTRLFSNPAERGVLTIWSTHPVRSRARNLRASSITRNSA